MIKIYYEINDDLKKDWSEIEKNSNFNPYFNLDNIISWYENFGKYSIYSLSIAIYYDDDDKPKLILPFGIKKKFGFFICIWLCEPFNDFNEPIIHEDFFIDKKLFLHIFNQFITNNKFKIDLCFLKNQKSKNLKKINPFIAYFKNYYQNSNYKINLDGDFNTFCKVNLKRKIVREIERKTEKYNNNALIYQAQNLKDQIQIINFFLKNKKKQIIKTKSFDYLKTENNQKYFLNLVNRKNVIMHAVKYKQNIVAAHLGYVNKDIFYYTFPVHDEEYKNFSFGTYLLNFLVKECFENKIKEFNFGIGYQLYKKQWSNFRGDIFLNCISLNFKGFLLKKFLLLSFEFSILKKFIKKISN